MFVAGKSYVVKNPEGVLALWACIHANAKFGWLTQNPESGGAAYCWRQDGASKCLPVTYEVLGALEAA